jgi:serpin B
LLKDASSGKNTMISPLSFLTAMGLLENGASGDTLKEMEDALGMDIGSFNDWYDALAKLMILNGGDALNISNSVWFKDDPTLKVSEDFLKKTAEIYGAESFMAPFTDETLNDINGWVNDNTKGMIPSVLDSISKDSMMYLINATCFEGAWFKPYEDDQIKEGETFTKEDGTEQKATMLYSCEDEASFYENELLTGTSKAYKDGYMITFLLPKKGETVGSVLESLKGDDIHDIMMSGTMADVDLVIPEFGFDYTAPDCIKALNEMGIYEVFDEDMADLSEMAETTDGSNLYVDTVIHKTHIELDRKGTKAAASTAVGIAKATAAMGEVPKREVRLDRPFIFVITDSQTDTPVFMGTVGSLEG